MGSEDDRRDEGRAAIELKVEYKRLNTFIADYTKNISRGGTFIGTEKPLPLGTEFVFALVLPTIEQPLKFRGKVMWTTMVDEASKANPAGMGIEFQYSSDEERAEIEKVVEGIIVKQLGEHLTTKLLS